jgi:hypothetical protein
VPNLEDYAILREFEDVFSEMSDLPPKRDIDFSIDLMLGATPVSKTPYRMSTPMLKELQMQLEELLKGYICPKCLTLECPNALCKEEGWNLKVMD